MSKATILAVPRNTICREMAVARRGLVPWTFSADEAQGHLYVPRSTHRVIIAESEIMITFHRFVYPVRVRSLRVGLTADITRVQRPARTGCLGYSSFYSDSAMICIHHSDHCRALKLVQAFNRWDGIVIR